MSELSAALQEQADEVTAAGLLPQLPQVRARVRRVRRRRAAGWVAAGLAAVAGIFVAGSLLQVATPPQVARPPASTVVLPSRIEGFQLVDSEVGRRGDRRITLSLPLPRGYALAPICRGPDPSLDTRLVVNGVHVGGVLCGQESEIIPSFGRKDLRRVGVDTSRGRLDLSLSLVEGRFHPHRAREPGTVLALGVYRAVR